MQDNNGEYSTNAAYMLWVDGKATKISSDRQCLIPHANQALHGGLKADITHHPDYKEAYSTLLSGISFDDYMDTDSDPNPNRFIKSSWILSLVWTAKFFSYLSRKYQNWTLFNNAFTPYVRCFNALRLALHLPTGTFTTREAIPNTVRFISGV